MLDTTSINIDAVLAWAEARASKNRKRLTQDISAGNTIDEECSPNKLFGYLLDRFRVGRICYGALHATSIVVKILNGLNEIFSLLL